MKHRFSILRRILFGVLCVGNTGLLAQSVEPGLIGHWLFSPAHVTEGVVKDLAGNFDGRIGLGVTFQDNPPAARFDPRSISGEEAKDFGVIISLEQNAEGLPRRAITLEAWVKIHSPISWGAFVGCFQDSNTYERGWVLGCDVRYRRQTFALGTLGGRDYLGRQTYLPAGQSYQPGVWYHVVGTYGGYRQSIYIDGKEENATLEQFGYIFYPEDPPYRAEGDIRTSPFTIGNYYDENENNPFHGLIHEIRIYDRALSADKVKSHFESKKTLFESDHEGPNG